jgi:ribokinase
MSSSQKNITPKSITVIGSINCDFTSYVESFPLVNQTTHARRFAFNVGGKGLNQAVAAARVGAQVSFVGCVGDDLFGSKALEYLNENNVDTSHIRVLSNEVTGTANILVSDSGENMIAVTPGANAGVNSNDVALADDLIRNSDVVIVQLEIPVEAVKQTLTIASQHNVLTILNPAPALGSDIELVSLADIVTPNETELISLSGVDIISSSLTDTVNDHDNIKMLSRMLLDKGANTIVTTLGAEGCFVISEKTSSHIPSISVNVVDPTGAGDVFTGVLAVALAEDNPLTEAAQFAAAAAALSVTKTTVANAAPYRNEISTFLRNNSV